MTGFVAHRPALDGARGIAVAGVVAFHLDRLGGGFLGVDLFFVLSGFLITTLLVAEAGAAGRVSLRAFWVRRARRLLPAATLLLAVVLGWLAVWGTPAEQATSRSDARWALPYLANWHLIAEARDYWAASTSPSAFTHLWSLAVEEQFYVVWPLVAWALLRGGERGERRLLLVASAAAAASLVAMVVLHDPARPERAYLGSDTRASSILLGAMVAVPALRRPLGRALRGRAGAPLLAGSIAVLAATWTLGGHHLDGLLRGGLALHAAASAVIVVALAADGATPLQRALSARPLQWLGRLSYGVYLWHWPILRLGRPRLGGWPPLAVELFVVAASLLAAAVSYHLVEQPIRRERRWAAGRRAGVATVAVAALAALAVLAAPSGRGQVAAFDAATLATSLPSGTAATAVAPAASATSSSTTPATSTTATTSTTSAAPAAPAAPAAAAPAATAPAATAPAATEPPPPRRVVRRVLWTGDSIAADEAPAVVAALSAAGVEAVDGAFAARRLIASDGVDPDAIYTDLLRGHAPDVVVVQLSLWDSPFDHERQRAAFSWFHRLVRDAGADLVIVTAPPVRPDLIDPGMARQVQVAAELAASDPAHTHLLDATEVWGGELRSDLEGDGAPDRKPDGVHVCPQGAGRFASWLVVELAERFDGIVPADPAGWGAGPWSADGTYDTPVGACAALG